MVMLPAWVAGPPPRKPVTMKENLPINRQVSSAFTTMLMVCVATRLRASVACSVKE